MARRYINTSQFNPYTFQELWQPAEAATQAHVQQATAYSQLGAQAAMLGEFIDPQRDPEEYAAWNEFTTNLRNGSDSLMRNGLTSNTYNTLWRSTVDYAGKIKPIELAVENKQKFAQMLNQTSLQHPSTLFIKDANDYSLKDYRQGIPQPELIDMDAVQKEAETIAAIYANDKIRFMDPVQYDRYHQIITEKYGDTFDEALNGINDPNSRLNVIKQLVLESNGANRLLENGKTGGYNRLDKAVDMGILAGAVGKRDAKLNTDNAEFRIKEAHLALSQRAQRLNELKMAQEMAAADPNNETLKIMNSLVDEPGQGINSRRVTRWYTAGNSSDAKDMQQTLLNRMTAASRFKNGDVNKGIKVLDAKGKEQTLKIDDKEKNPHFAIAFEGCGPGEKNRKSSTYYKLKWNNKTYYVTPDQLAVDNHTKEAINYIFGSAIPPAITSTTSPERQQEISDLWNQKRLVERWRKDPMMLSPDELETVQYAIDQLTTKIGTAMYEAAKAETTSYRQK